MTEEKNLLDILKKCEDELLECKENGDIPEKVVNLLNTSFSIIRSQQELIEKIYDHGKNTIQSLKHLKNSEIK